MDPKAFRTQKTVALLDMNHFRAEIALILLIGILISLASCTKPSAPTAENPSAHTMKVTNDEEGEAATALPSSQLPDTARWTPLFNGRNLDGWTAKFTHSPVGENVLNTFRVEDGVLSVNYSEWDEFEGRVGHLFTEQRFSRYILRLEYRFVGEQVSAGPTMGWAVRNNGAMLHSQSAESMQLAQEFPVSIEAQLLGGGGKGERTTGNLCTPGTHVRMNGALITEHCTYSASPTYRGDQWVKAEFEVLGSDRIRHFINGELVLEYHNTQYDPSSEEAEAQRAGGSVLLERGHIALQAESHPTQFRNIEIYVLSGEGT